MRPYRGKTEDGKWVYGCPVKLLDGDIVIIQEAARTGPQHPMYPSVAIGKYSFVIPETVGQFTGLHWKNDILESQDGLRRYIVTYNDKQCKWYLKGIGKAWAENDPVWSEYNHIGNVHDNPELE